jgi:hypothetical protein
LDDDKVTIFLNDLGIYRFFDFYNHNKDILLSTDAEIALEEYEREVFSKYKLPRLSIITATGAFIISLINLLVLIA